jgi:hypothetical protein
LKFEFDQDGGKNTEGGPFPRFNNIICGSQNDQLDNITRFQYSPLSNITFTQHVFFKQNGPATQQRSKKQKASKEAKRTSEKDVPHLLTKNNHLKQHQLWDRWID